MPINLPFAIEFCREIEGEFLSPNYGDSFSVDYSSSLSSILSQIRSEIPEITPLSQIAQSKSLSFKGIHTKKRDSDVMCCFTQA
jgi:hypothetical protein